MIRRLIYKQKEGEGKGAVVEITSERGNILHLKEIKTGFEYAISIRSFQMGYERIENVRNPRAG